MLELDRTHVDVWYWDLTGLERMSYLAKAESVMSDQEKQRRSYMQRPIAQEAFSLSRFFLRACLSKYSAVHPHEWRFSQNEHGKPAIAQPSLQTPLHFNLSHTSDGMALAVAASGPVGVDVENASRRTPLLQTAMRFYSAAELAVLQSLPPTEQRRRFFEYWTLREAYVKARGLAIAVLFKHLCFEFSGSGDITLQPAAALGDQTDLWDFGVFWPGPAHCLAVAARRSGASSTSFSVQEFR